MTDCTSYHFSSYTVLDLFLVLLKYTKDPLKVIQNHVSYTSEIAVLSPMKINCTKNVVQAEIHNEQPIRDLHTSYATYVT